MGTGQGAMSGSRSRGRDKRRDRDKEAMTGLRGKERRGRMLWIWQGEEKVHLSSFLPAPPEKDGTVRGVL